VQGVGQATVRTFSAPTRSGSVLLDDGTEIPFDAGAFEQSGLRKLRLGQRVRVQLAGEGAGLRVTRLTLATFPLDG
jgi:2-phospho-L-lactate/phosphoenolpyruvate guanylyltransferase